MDHTVAEEYKSSLNDLNFNSKPLISMLTMLADENKKHASLIIDTIVNHIRSVAPESKLPGLYLVDSIMKNVGDQYLKIFYQQIVSLFTSVFEKVDESTRSLMFKLRQTWADILPNKILHNLDMAVKKLDPAWPVTSKSSSKTILANPKFLDGTAEEKGNSDAPCTTLKKEEEKIKQKQAEALKELLAKQEQLRILEMKKLQQTMKKKLVAGNNSIQWNPLKHIPARDPRIVKISKKCQNVIMKESAMHGKVASTLESNPVTSSPVEQDSTISRVPTKMSQTSKNESRKNVILAQENPVNKTPLHQNVGQVSELQALSQKKSLEKPKCDNRNVNKNESNSASVINKNVFKSKVENKERRTVIFKKPCDFNDGNKALKEDISVKPIPKVKLSSPKKRNIASTNCHKLLEPKLNCNQENNNKNDNQFKLSKENEISNPLNTDTLTKAKSKIDLIVDNKSIEASFEIVNEKVDNQVSNKPVDLLNTNKSIDINDCVKNLVHTDEDCKNKFVALSETTCLKVPKREVEESNRTNEETENTEPPKKKIKSEDIENLNPDHRKPDSHVLFGNEDQDLRKSAENISSEDKFQGAHPKHQVSIKQENNPDPIQQENILLPVKQESTPVHVKEEDFDRRFSSDKQPASARQFFQNEFVRWGPGRYQTRGRFNARLADRRAHTFRHSGRPLHAPDIGQVMLNPSGFIQQAQEKYQSGKISEIEYKNICFDLQKMLKSPEYQRFKNSMSRMQTVENEQMNPDAHKLRQESYNHKSHTSYDNLKIQGPSVFLPPVKPFVLDGKRRFVYFVEDRAVALMDNNEPRELIFKNEQREIYIDGLAGPITLGFDGKSFEFEVDGRRHIIRFGIPGREIFINNHPYEACFGGPPIAAMLEDGCVYKIRLSGPPPQVLIGNNIECQLFARYHGNIQNSAFKNLPDTNKKIKLEGLDSDSASHCALQDVDMRIKSENLQQSDVLLNRDSPFYSDVKDDMTDMKDVDWRIPPASNLEVDKKLHENKNFEYKNSESWSEENKEKIQKISYEKISEPIKLPQESPPFEWKAPIKPQNSSIQVDAGNRTNPSYETWRFKEEDKYNWKNKEHGQNDYPGQLQRDPTYQVQSDRIQHFSDQKERYVDLGRNRQPFVSHLQRPIFNYRHMKGQFRGHFGRSWVPQADTGPPTSTDIPQINLSTAPRPALLPSPAYPPYSVSSNLPSVINNTSTVQNENFEGSICDFQPEPAVTEFQQSEPPAFDMKVDVQSLLEKLVAAGIINSKTDEEPTSEAGLSESVDTDVKADSSDALVDKVPIIDLSSECLKVRHNGVSSALHKGFQCASCGMRFKEIQSEHYSRHLDWHFRLNRKEKDGAKKAFSRRWYIEIEDWIQFEEFEDFEERVPSYFDLEAENEQSDVPELPVVVSVPATSNDDEFCPVCHENFQLFWVEEEEEWHLRNAVRHDDDIYHPACYEDFKKASEALRAGEAENTAENVKDLASNSDELSSDKNEELLTILNELLDNVCTEVKLKSEVPKEEIFPDCSNNNVEVPSIEMLSEEEIILEGKPGEEEIIGLISDSDIESEVEFPKIETKMIVMQSGGITLKVKAESLHNHSSSNRSSPSDKSFSTTSSEKETKSIENKILEKEENYFRPPTPDPNFQVMPPVSKGTELSGLCCIM